MKIIESLKVKFVKWVINNFDHYLDKEYIVSLYKARRYKETFQIREKIVNVKKGKRRYTLLFLEGPDGKMRFNLGRY